MKRQAYYLGMLALPLMFTACSDDNLLAPQGPTDDMYAKGKVINLDENFRLFASRGEDENVSTRGEWVTGNNTYFYWMPKGVVIKDAASHGDISSTDFTLIAAELAVGNIPENFDNVGLCWVGESGPQTEVYTNYQFTHDGWLELGADKLNKWPVECIDGKYYYNWNYAPFADVVTKGGAMTVTIEDDGAVKGAIEAGKEVDAHTTDPAGISGPNQKKISNLNLRKGTFATANKSIFAGNYIAYYPYTNKMIEKTALQATMPTTMDYVVGNKNRLISAGDYTFSCGYMTEKLEGGINASSLKMDQFSGLLALRVYFNDKLGVNSDYAADKKIQKMILLDEKGGFISEVKLSAQGIAATTAAAVSGKAAAFKEAMIEGSAISEQTLSVNFTNGTATTNLAFDKTITNIKPGTTNGTNVAEIILPLLPTEISKVRVLLVNDEGKASMATINNLKIESGKIANGGYQTLEFAPTTMYVATDQPSLTTAMTNATNANQILLLGDVKIASAAYDIISENITGEYNGEKVGRLIVAGSDNATQTVVTVSKSTLACDVLVESKGCCHNTPGKLIIDQTTYGKGTAETPNTIINNGEVEFGTSGASTVTVSTINGNIVNQPFKYVAGGKDASGATYELDFETIASSIKILKKATVKVYGAITNNYATAKNAARVDGLISLEMKLSGDADGQDGRLDFAFNETTDAKGSLVNYATVENRGTVANNTGISANIKNEELATFVNMIGGQLNGWKMVKVKNSNFISEVDNAIDTRFANAVKDNLTNIIRIETKNTSYTSEKQVMDFPMEGISNKDLKFVINTTGVTLVGRKQTDVTPDYVFTTIPATIGALEVTAKATDFKINLGAAITNGNGGDTDPVSLSIDNTNYNTIHTVSGAGVPVNNLYPVAIPAIDVLATGAMTANTGAVVVETPVKLTVTGDFNTVGTASIGTNKNYPILEQVGNINVKGTFNYGEKVILGKVNGNFNVVSGGNATFDNDSKIKFYGIEGKGVFTNKGTCTIKSATSVKSPAVVYCNSYNLTGGTWTNGNPTPFTAAGVVEGDYNW